MTEESRSNLRIEELKTSHFQYLDNTQRGFLDRLLQTMLISNWVAQAERNLPGLLPTRASTCLAGIEGKRLVAYIIACPYNQRGSCWSISLPNIISSQITSSSRDLRYNLINSAVSYKNEQVKNWILRSPVVDTEQIAIARELGFQPFKVLQRWVPPSRSSNEFGAKIPSHFPEQIQWEPITKTTAKLLMPLERASCSSHLRQIVDRQWIDLLGHKESGSGVLINKVSNKPCAIAGLIPRKDSENKPLLELIRDIAWDPRLYKTINVILNNLVLLSDKRTIVETSSDDHQLNHLLEELRWQRESEEILFGRSLLKRQPNKKLIKGTKQLKAILGPLNPQNPPLPSPTLSKR